MILAIALTVMGLFFVAGLSVAARQLHISNLDAQALAEKVAFPDPASALEWPELRVRSAVPQPDELSPVIVQVAWPAYPERVAILCRGAELELRRRQSLERVHAILLAEDYQDEGRPLRS